MSELGYIGELEAERDAAREDANRLAEALRRHLPTISVVIAATRRSDLVEALRLHDEEARR